VTRRKSVAPRRKGTPPPSADATSDPRAEPSGDEPVTTTVELDPAPIPDAGLLQKKQALARLVVHDLRNPLSALQGNIELMREELLGHAVPSTVAESLDDCAALVAKSLALVASILDVEELEDGVLRARTAPTELEGLIDRAIAANRPALRIRTLRFDVDVPAGLSASLDGELMYRVLENLLDNAVRYAPRNGHVAVRARRDGEAVEIAVGNDGPPVPVAERQAIFDRYYRIEARRASARAGRGLGLYFCKLAALAHGGTLTVEERPPLAAVFVLRLPQ